MISRSGTEWIAVLTPDVLKLKNVGDFVCEWFFDFHTLPFDVSRVQVTLGRAFGMACLRGQASPLTLPQEDELLGDSRSMRDLRKILSKFAPTQSPILIRGESGTGKELVARTLHRQSQRNGKPFVAINCGSIPDHLIQSELFGHEKGAFTGAHQRKIGRIEAANGGTLFLDEIGDLPMELQANLLRFLQEKHIERVGGSQPIPVDVRVLAATHVDLEAAIVRGRFREDLYYRLNVLQVITAPLRERHGDLAMLASHFARYYSLETGRRPRSFSDDALIAMGNHGWPGNVRELANRVRRGLVLAEGRQIEAHDLGLDSSPLFVGEMSTLEEYKDRAERQALCEVLHRHSDNLSVAARVLGVSRPTFYRLLHKHNIR
jgi:DNA-binding NtrC family response regulator